MRLIRTVPALASACTPDGPLSRPGIIGNAASPARMTPAPGSPSQPHQWHPRHGASRAPFAIPPNNEVSSSRIPAPGLSPGGGARGGRRLHCVPMLDGWWTMEFVLFDIGATLALLIGYLTVVIRNGAI